jgi:pimeloyl-ACP methyl ester carboxylesterase
LYQFGPLSDAGFYVVAVDCRGYGWSAKPAAVAEYSMQKVMSDLLRVVDTVAPGRKCTIVSSSAPLLDQVEVGSRKTMWCYWKQ